MITMLRYNCMQMGKCMLWLFTTCVVQLEHVNLFVLLNVGFGASFLHSIWFLVRMWMQGFLFAQMPQKQPSSINVDWEKLFSLSKFSSNSSVFFSKFASILINFAKLKGELDDHWVNFCSQKSTLLSCLIASDTSLNK